MFEWKIEGRDLYIREPQNEAELHAIEEIQKEAWGFSDLDVIPLSHLVAAQWAGGIVLCAFEGDKIIGFAYGFPAYDETGASIHSHMLAVRPAYRNLQAGFFLKLAQREQALKKGLSEITWTFDPLQSLNAHLNFTKLGVIARRYIVNFYGETTSSPLHQGFGTDRLWVNWLLDTERVNERVGPVAQAAPNASLKVDLDDKASLPQSALVEAEGERPRLNDFSNLLAEPACFIEIPHNIARIKERDPALASDWRQATRAAFQSGIEAGFMVKDFLLFKEARGTRRFYLLSRQ